MPSAVPLSFGYSLLMSQFRGRLIVWGAGPAAMLNVCSKAVCLPAIRSVMGYEERRFKTSCPLSARLGVLRTRVGQIAYQSPAQDASSDRAEGQPEGRDSDKSGSFPAISTNFRVSQDDSDIDVAGSPRQCYVPGGPVLASPSRRIGPDILNRRNPALNNQPSPF